MSNLNGQRVYQWLVPLVEVQHQRYREAKHLVRHLICSHLGGDGDNALGNEGFVPCENQQADT